MRRKTGINMFFRVHLDKHIPFEAGLGGGSGNAATAMFAFNALCETQAQSEELELWAADIGSDISFFFSSGTAYCTGKGESVQSLDPLKHTVVHIFKPAWVQLRSKHT
jgi:4-diphosphocytidyl-2-C-methyl-D-erythritol kinase